ncbi:MAG TPA: exosortase/archaeosortase family protein [Candidatus Acidoferrales bacterium]|nr:exosortase/archaeosortase family protein [Candidatus Acidoferrales bacterium]
MLELAWSVSGKLDNEGVGKRIIMELDPAQKALAYQTFRFLGMTTAIALAVYYIPNYWFLENWTALHSAAVMNMVGMKASVWYQGTNVFVNQFEVERMCTGVQVIAVFLGIIAALPRTALKKKILAFGIIAVSVYLANIGRIVLEIWLLYSGLLPWSLAHYPTGLILGVFSVAFLVIVADHFMPAIGDIAMSALDGFKKPTTTQ